MKESVIFAGDSYTWGEGLQLYIDNEFWIKERSKPNDWLNLKPKCTSETEKFREENRFAGIVSNFYDYNLITFPHDGVSFWESVELIEQNINTPNLKFIVYQFTILDRLPIILDPQLSNSNLFNENDTLTGILSSYIQHKIFNNTIEKKSECQIQILKEVYNIDIDEILQLSIDELKKFYYDFLCKKLLDTFVTTFVNKWKQKCDVYFIDSWFYDSSDTIQKSETIKNNIIPLIGTDGKLYKKWSDWEYTFKYKNIIEEFPETGNGHPTLEQHKYLAKSIIKFINESEK